MDLPFLLQTQPGPSPPLRAGNKAENEAAAASRQPPASPTDRHTSRGCGEETKGEGAVTVHEAPYTQGRARETAFPCLSGTPHVVCAVEPGAPPPPESGSFLKGLLLGNLKGKTGHLLPLTEVL